MGLELSLARLKALAKFAFGMGLTQVLFGQDICVVVHKQVLNCATYFGITFSIDVNDILKLALNSYLQISFHFSSMHPATLSSLFSV